MDRYQRSTTLQTGLVNNSAGAEGDALAQELQRFTDRRMQDLAREAERTGAEQGTQAGSEGEPKERSNFTIAGQSFNRAAKLAHQAALQTDIRDSIGQLAIEHDDDPEIFQAKVAGLRDGMIETAGADYVPFIRQRVADYGGHYLMRVSQNQQAKLEKEAINDMARGAEGFLQDAMTASYEQDFPLVEARRQELAAVLDAGVEAGYMETGARDDMMERFEVAVTGQEVVGQFMKVISTEGLPSGATMLADWNKGKPSELGLGVDDHQKIGRMMAGRLAEATQNARLATAQATAEQKAAIKAATARAKDSIKVLKSGFPLYVQDQQALEADIMTAGDPALFEEYKSTLKLQGTLGEFRGKPEAIRQQEIDELTDQLNAGGDGPTQMERITRLDALEKLHKDLTKAWDTDPRAAANTEGMIEDEPLDLANWRESLAPQLYQRQESGSIGEAFTGKAMPLINVEEAEQIGAQFDLLPAQDKADMLSMLVAGAGEDQAVATLGLIFDKGNSDMAVMGQLVLQGRKPLVGQIMYGREVLAANSALKPKRLDYQPDLDKKAGTALAGAPEVRAMYEGLVMAKYAELKNRSGDLGPDYDRGLYRDAVEAVMPVVEYNGDQVMAPLNVNEDQFEDWTDSWQPEHFAEVADVVTGARSAEDMLELIEDEGTLVDTGVNGLYGVTVVSADEGIIKSLMKADGKPFYIRFGD